MTLAPYPKYRPSGIEWLGEVPEHWEETKLKHVLRRVIPGGTPDVANEDYWTNESDTGHAWVAIADMYERVHVRTTRRRITEAGRASKRLLVAPPGTLLYSMYATLGRVGVLEVHAAFNQAILGVEPNPVLMSSRFLFYFLGGFQRYIEVLSSTNTQDNLSAGKVRNMAVVVPSIPEQQVISAFLDGETAKLDVIVQRQRTLIERLREKRSALITDTVRRGLPPEAARAAGLDPHPPRKPSGIEWLGDIPAHWETRRLRHFLARNESGVWGEDADSDGTPVLRSTEQTVEGGWRIREPAIRRLPEAERSRYRLVRGDLVVTTSSGSARHIGKTRLVTEAVERLNACFSNFMQRLRCSESLEPRLAHYLLNSPTGREQLVFHSSTTTGLANLNGAVLSNVWLAVPPAYREQEAIADYLDRETARLDALVAKIETAIERLREYRSALITAAVTGKVDVRSARQPAPTDDGPVGEALRS